MNFCCVYNALDWCPTIVAIQKKPKMQKCFGDQKEAEAGITKFIISFWFNQGPGPPRNVFVACFTLNINFDNDKVQDTLSWALANGPLVLE